MLSLICDISVLLQQTDASARKAVVGQCDVSENGIGRCMAVTCALPLHTYTFNCNSVKGCR